MPATDLTFTLSQSIGLRTALLDALRAENTYKAVCAELGLEPERVRLQQDGSIVLLEETDLKMESAEVGELPNG